MHPVSTPPSEKLNVRFPHQNLINYFMWRTTNTGPRSGPCKCGHKSGRCVIGLRPGRLIGGNPAVVRLQQSPTLGLTSGLYSSCYREVAQLEHWLVYPQKHFILSRTTGHGNSNCYWLGPVGFPSFVVSSKEHNTNVSICYTASLSIRRCKAVTVSFGLLAKV